MAAIFLTPPTHFQGGDSEYYGCETLTYCMFPWLGEGGSKYYVRVGIWNNMVLGYYLLVSMVRRRGFKILWLRYIEPPPIHFQGGDLQ
jgi:hypothetical protein